MIPFPYQTVSDSPTLDIQLYSRQKGSFSPYTITIARMHFVLQHNLVFTNLFRQLSQNVFWGITEGGLSTDHGSFSIRGRLGLVYDTSSAYYSIIHLVSARSCPRYAPPLY
jgi:hypothetical protein